MSDVFAIYNYVDSARDRKIDHQETQGPQAFYSLLYVYDSNGLIEQSTLEKVYRNSFNSDDYLGLDNGIGPFQDLSSVNQFAFNLCEEVNAHGVGLLSVEAFNQLMENVSDKQEFNQKIKENSEYIENLEHQKKGFFGKIFD